jgi:16S rRNA pseudouridine516 synthase
MQKLQRLLLRGATISKARLPELLRQGRVLVDGQPVEDRDFPISRFHRIVMEGVVVQAGERALYFMVHKPVGHVSATVDKEHPTVVSLVDDPDRSKLHLAGRLDRSTSGLVLLTNDGTWSKRITAAEYHVAKIYHVTTEQVITEATVAAFAAGFYFHTEDITTLPARLEITAPREARLTLHEGRYHQIKRMFHRVQNRVVRLHRESIGGLALPSDLRVGEARELSAAERLAVFNVTVSV